MKDHVRALSAALDGEELPNGSVRPDARLIHLGDELDAAFRTWRLPDQDRTGILVRALAMAEQPAATPRRLALPRVAGRRLVARGLRLAHPGRLTSALIGGTAVVAVAAIGITVVHQKRAHGSATAWG
ncbi:MAG: hypothetical protein ABR564_05770 [Candidatus Dormibacteria bacterium]